MKRILVLTCTLAFAVCAFTSTVHAQTTKIGTVDMEKIFKGYYKTKDAESKINEARSTAKKELDDRMDTYKQTVDSINKLKEELQGGSLSEERKKEKMKSYDDKASELRVLEREITDFRASKEKYLQDQAVRMRNDIVTDITKLVQDKVAKDGYDYVFDRSGPSLNGVPVVVFARDSVDFSDEIITALNKNRGKDTSNNTPAASATPKATPKPASAPLP